jgi:hypothetical protein
VMVEAGSRITGVAVPADAQADVSARHVMEANMTNVRMIIPHQIDNGIV